MISPLVFALLTLAQNPPISEPAVTPKAESAAKSEAPVSKTDPTAQANSTQQKESNGKNDRHQRHGRQRGPEARKWWEGLSEEERQEARRNFKRYRELSPEPKAELDRRHEFIKQEIATLLEEMPAEEREALMNLEPEERKKRIRHMVHRRLQERMPQDEEHPGRPPHGDFRGQSFEERLQGSKEAIDQSKHARLGKEMDRAVQEGWVGRRAADFYRHLPPEAVQNELMKIRQWRIIDRLNHSNAWPELGIDAEGKQRLLSMPPDEFFHFMKDHKPAKEFRRRNPPSKDRRGPHPGERPTRDRKRGDREKKPEK